MIKLTAEVSADSLSKLVEQFTSYTGEFRSKNREFVDRLASIGIPVIDEKFGAFKGDSQRGHSTYITYSDDGAYRSTAKLVVENKDILFIEFGAGIKYNNSKAKNEKASELGYGVGSYPHQKHAFSKNGWFYEDHGIKIHSYGTEASMPMQSAVNEIILQIRNIAREVFVGE